MKDFEDEYRERLLMYRKKMQRMHDEKLNTLQKDTDVKYREVRDRNLEELEKQMKQMLIEKNILPEVFEDVHLELELERKKALNIMEEREKFQRIQDILKD